MRTALVLFTTLLLIAACSGEDAKAAKKQKIKGLKEQLRAANARIDEFQNSPEFKDATTASFKAQAALLGAKRSKDEARIEAAQAAYDDAAAAGKEVFARQEQLNKEMRDLRDKILDLGGTP
jgi:chromosome segregation ATPase